MHFWYGFAVTLAQVRIGAVILSLLALLWMIYNRRALLAHLRAYLFEPSTPRRLALLRVALFGGLVWAGSRPKPVWWASQPEKLRVPPPGWGFAEGLLPIDGLTATVAQYVVVGCAACAALGLLTRICAPIAAITAVYLLGMPSFFGKILHIDHALVMMALVVSAAPAGDALSVDRLWKRRKGALEPGPSAAYTLPMRVCWVLLATVYFFPGMWKLWNAGDLWLDGQRLLWVLQRKWNHHRYLIPAFRIDHYRWLLALLGTATLVFEVGFLFAVFHRTTRALYALGGCAFHAGVRILLGIKFYALLPAVMLFDLPIFAGEKDGPAAAESPAGPSLWPAATVGALLLVGQLYVGVARIDTWPLAMHPVFDERKPPAKLMSGFKIRLHPRDGGKPRDIVYVLSKRGGGAGFVRTMRDFDHDVARHIPRQATGRAIVAMLRANGLALETDDRIVFYKTFWKSFPIGEREGYREQPLRRYRVTEEDGLEQVR